MTVPKRIRRDSLTSLVGKVDSLPRGETPPDTVPSGFPSLDRFLGGGFRQRDLIVLGGDVGSGKSALAYGFALRAAMAGYHVAYCSGEMDEDRLLERALAIEAQVQVDEIRSGDLSDAARASVGAAAVRLRDLPILIHPLLGQRFHEALAPAWENNPKLVVVDYLQLLPPPEKHVSHAEDCAAAIGALKSSALERKVACLAVAQLPAQSAASTDRRPTLDDFGALGSVKQHADIVLGLYREDMYSGGPDVEGATELTVLKNRNGPTGFIDLYFHRQWMRFEDMLDPTR